MALSIVRNDITKMEVDAIVNSTNERLVPGGLGVDASIHYAAGPGLADALNEIGYCPTGSCVLTDAYNIGTCKYIIHAVGPVYDAAAGAVNTEAYRKGCLLIEQCYRSIYCLAREHACRSVAVPLISAGANGFPTAEVYRIATGAARDFLLSLKTDEDMMIYIVLYDRESIGVSRRVSDEIRHLISDHYHAFHKQELMQFYSRAESSSRRSAGREPRNIPVTDMSRPAAEEDTRAETAGDYREQDKSFPDMCEWWCSKKHISKHRFYTDANITRQTFGAMKKHPNQVPKKTNVLACAIGLRLDLDQTKDLLARAGMTLSPYFALDKIVEYYIKKREYDIYEINAVLFEADLSLLGTVARES